MLTRRVLTDDVRIRADDEVLEPLDALFATAEHAEPAERSLAYEVEAQVDGGGCRVVEDGDDLAARVDVNTARDLVHQRAHRRAFELASRRGWLRIHGGLVDVDGHRIAVIGPSGAGKSTLCLRFLLDGADFQGDESLLVRGREAQAVPRPIHLKAGAADIQTEVAEVLGGLPVVEGVALLDPARVLGREWRLTTRALDAIVLLGTGRHERTLSTADALPHLLAEVFPVVEGKRRVVGALSDLLRDTPVHPVATATPAAMSALIRDRLA